jgi:iron complex outermembrane receptor protein
VPNTIVDQDDEVWSVYGQMEYDLTEETKVTLGLRWTEETKEGTNTTSIGLSTRLPDEDILIGRDEIAIATANPLSTTCPPDNGLPCVSSAADLHQKSEEWGGRLSIDHRLTESVLIYGNVSRGFKGGGFSVAALQGILGLAAQPVEPEVLLAYEAGWKAGFFDRSLKFNGALFYYDWKDLQSFQTIFDPSVGIAIPQLLNIPETTLQGAELEVEWIPAETWFVQVGLGYLDSKIENADNIVGVEEGNELVRTPKFSANGLIAKDFEVGVGLLTLQTDFRYLDEVTYSLTDDPLFREGDQFFVNARASYRFGSNQQYQVDLWGKNLTGTQYFTDITDLSGLSDTLLVTPNDGEQIYGVTLTVDF